MTRIEVELEAVTALLVHREPKGQAEWRAPSLRGLMRWWYRALMGAALSPEQVKLREAQVFGGTEQIGLEKARSSAVLVRVKSVGRPDVAAFDVNPGGERTANRKGITPGARAIVSLVLSPHGGTLEDLKAAYCALWLGVHFGGLGQRARRGAGSLRMTRADIPESLGELPKPVNEKDINQLSKGLAAGLKRCWRASGADALRTFGSSAPYPILHPKVADVRCCKLAAADETEARRSIMQKRRTLDSHQKDSKGNTLKPEHEFGFAPQEGKQRDRLSSPTLIRIAHVGREDGLLVGSVFRHVGADRPDWDNAIKFLESFKPFAKVDLG